MDALVKYMVFPYPALFLDHPVYTETHTLVQYVLFTESITPTAYHVESNVRLTNYKQLAFPVLFIQRQAR